VVAPAPVAKGRLAITVTPADAELSVDGAAATAGTLEVDAGSHTIAARAACFRDGKVDVEVKAGEEKPVAVKLRPLERVVRVTSNPPSAQLLVDNAPAGRTPAEVRLVGRLDPRARHTFTVRRPGFLDTRTVVAPDADCATEGDVGVVALHLSLTPLRSRPAPRPAPPRPAPATTVPEPKPTPLVVPPTDPPEPEPEPEPEAKPPEPAPAPTTPPAEAPAPRPAPVETTPGTSSAAPAESKPAEAAPAPKPEPEKKDCDPSPDAPEWARCK
jgi:Meckel syndrome type 1 protein